MNESGIQTNRRVPPVEQMMSAQDNYNKLDINGSDVDMEDNENLIGGNESAGSAAVNSSSGAAVAGASFPLARIKKIMKADEDVNLVSAETVHLVSLATELFVDALVKKASEMSQNEKRRTILYKDFSNAVKKDVKFSFLQELIPETVSVQAALEAQKQSGMLSFSTPNQSSPSTPQKISSENLAVSDDDHFNIPLPLKHSTASKSSSGGSVQDFFAKRSNANVINLLNSSETLSDQIVDISTE